MSDFGAIVLARFPFTDLSGDKRRPAPVVSRNNRRRADLAACFISSATRTGVDMAPIAATAETGLKVASMVRFDKIAPPDRGIGAGQIGVAPASWLARHKTAFFDVSGFGRP